MKKVLVAMMLVAFALISFGIHSFANETGNVVIHFQLWDGEYDDLGSWAWGHENVFGKRADGTDDFGAYFEYNDVPVGTSIGFIGVYWEGDGPNWDMKMTENVELSDDVIIAGKTVHVYVFEGAQTKTDDPQYFVADPDMFNALVVYFDPAGAYEENLGLCAWGWTTSGCDWGNPDPAFGTAGKSPGGVPVLGFILHTEEDWAGFLIYAGDDATKKTGDLKPDTGFFTEQEDGKVDVLYVVNAGDGVTNNSNVYTDPALFADAAFSFNLLPFNLDNMSGTYAVDPNTVIVATGVPVASPYPDAEDKVEARATIEGWFEIREILAEGVYGAPLVIERVDFATTNTTLNAFVIILADGSELDNTKDYAVFFDLGLEENNLEASITLDLDRAAPVLTFISPTGIVGRPAAERIIEVPWGQPFNQNLFPRFRVDDNRDGDLTPFVFVPTGEYSVLDTRTEGDYTIMLRVEDRWGNVTEETFIFRVVRN